MKTEAYVRLDFRICPPLFVGLIELMCFNIQLHEIMKKNKLLLLMVRVRFMFDSNYYIHVCIVSLATESMGLPGEVVDIF